MVLISKSACLAGLLISVSVAAGAQMMRTRTDADALPTCAPVKGTQAWKDKRLSPECRAMAVIRSMTMEQKFLRLDHSFGPPPAGSFDFPQTSAVDGPNGIARGPFPGPPPPMAIGVTAFPNEIVVAASWNRDLSRQFGVALAEEWRGKGLSEIIGPTLNLMRTWHWGRSAETYGEDPYLAGEMAAAEVEGIQTKHVLAMIKHFTANNQDWNRVGHFPGYTGVNEIIPQKALEEIYYPAFRTAIRRSSASGVMCAYNQINGVFACNNKQVLANLRAWGLEGAISPDAVFAQHDAATALNAGVDRISGTSFRGLLQRGVISTETIDRVLFHEIVPMFRFGVFDDPPSGNAGARVSTPEHIALADRMIEEGSVLLKNKRELLPLNATRLKRIVVIGADAGPDEVVGEEGPVVYVEKLSVPADAIIQRAGNSVAVNYVNIGGGIRPLPVLHGDVLSTSRGRAGGLHAEYFRSGDLTGSPVLQRTEAALDLDRLPAEMGEEKISFSAPTSTWSARWTGRITPPVSGEYVFSLSGGGSATLFLGDKAVVRLDHVNFRATAFGTVYLAGGKPVSLRVEHSNEYALLGSNLHLGWLPPQVEQMASALKAAHEADVAIVFAGEQLGEGMDKRSLHLPGNQDAIIEAVARQNPQTVVVLNTSTPVSMPWIDKVGAVLETWYPGQESGKAIASLLFGDADPGGRLPMTFPVDETQGPATHPDEYPGVNGVARYDEGVLTGYRWYDAKQQMPLFPFGFGLSYTRFKLSGLKVEHEAGRSIVFVSVRNVGTRAGADVVQVYVGEPHEMKEPPSLLKAFEKVTLQPGETRELTIKVPDEELASWSEADAEWKLTAGKYLIKVGESSRELGLSAEVELPAQSFR